MRKLFYLLAVLTIFNGIAGAQKFSCGGASNVTLYIKDSTDQIFLDSVEAKLLRAVTHKINGKKNTPIDLYDITPWDGTQWNYRYNWQEIEQFKQARPENVTPTYYQYELIMHWDTSLNCANILSFSKKYYCPLFKTDLNTRKEVCAGIYNRALWHIPLSEYSFFLTHNEISKLYSIIKKEFISSINDDTASWKYYSDTTSFSYRTLVLNKTDSLMQMPLSIWTNQFSYWTLHAGLSGYTNPWCKTSPLTKRDKDTILNDRIDNFRDGKLIGYGESKAYLPSITIAEKWQFDTLSDNPKMQPYQYALKISRQIKSIAMNTLCYRHTTQYNSRLWLNFTELDSFSDRKTSQYYLVQIDNALFKKLTLKYYWQY